MRGSVPFTPLLGIRVVLKSIEQDRFHRPGVCLKGKREFQDLDGDVSQRIVGRKLILNHIRPGLATAEV